MKRLIRTLAIVATFTASASLFAQTTNEPPKDAKAVKSLISMIGDQTQIVGAYTWVASTLKTGEGSPSVGVQGNLYNWTIKLPPFQTTAKPGINYLYLTRTDRHVVGLGLLGSLTALPAVLQDTKENTGIIKTLPGNLSAIDWFIGVGTPVGEDKFRFAVSGGLSLKW